MTKEEKIKRFNELAQLDEIHENEIIHEEAQEEAPIPAPSPESAPYQPTAAERAEMKAIQEQKKIRFAQLAGLQDEDAPAPKLEEHDIPAKYVRPATIKISLLSEGLRKEVKRLMKSGRTKTSEFPEAIKKMISEEMAALGSAPMEELGMPAPSLATDPHGYPELDQFIDKLAFNVGNTITKHLGLQNEDPDFPYKANYIVDQLAHRLQNPA